jgi:predicted NACHT family NTPase
VLIDGLDELAGKRRDQVLAWLIDLLEAYPRSQFVLTSRPDPTSEARLSIYGFEQIDILPLDGETIPRFVDYWHRALREAPGVPNEEAEGLDALASGLKQRLETSPALFSLATVPLLCALLCVLNRDRRSALPLRREELYRQCAEMLASRRDLDRYGSPEDLQAGVLSDYPILDPVQIFIFLQDLAYHMVVNGYSQMSTCVFRRK